MGIDPSYGLFRLGTEQGGNIRLWRFAVDLQTARVTEAIELERERDHDRYRIDVDGHYLLVAVRNGLRFAEQLHGKIADPRLAAALDDFATSFPHARDFRDVVTHLDEYVLDQGRLQGKGKVAHGSSSWRATMTDGDVVLVYGPFAVPLLAVAAAASELMALADEVWLQAIRDNRDGLD